MTLYQPMNGWDGKVAVATSPDAVFSDASEMFNCSFDENHNVERRKQIGVRSPSYMPGRFEASGKSQGYFITGAMATKLYGVSDKTSKRSHADRGIVQFNLRIDFSSFPITVRATPAAAPVISSVVGATSGGTIPAGTSSYRVSAILPAGETAASAAVTVANTGSTSANTINWGAVAGATGYKVYGRTAGTELLIATLGNVLTYLDTGAITPAGALPAGQIKLVGYIMSGCLLDTENFDLQEGVYVERQFNFKVQNVIDVYDSDTDMDLAPYIV